MKKLVSVFAVVVSVICSSCISEDPNLNADGVNKIDSHLIYTDKSDQPYQDTVYIPVYSDIYSEHRLASTLLTATLSIRSTSLRDTTYIHSIDYYDTQGKLVRNYIDRTLILGPMQSIDYVIDRDDTSGGTGANFLVTWGAGLDTKPLFQAVMIGTSGQHGLSFITEGVSTSKR